MVWSHIKKREEVEKLEGTGIGKESRGERGHYCHNLAPSRTQVGSGRGIQSLLTERYIWWSGRLACWLSVLIASHHFGPSLSFPLL